tara:strand:+ start:502 stop:780 length:279 start_codon:yes stop_codon:yes gene_type:complete
MLNELFGENNPENNYDKLVEDNFKKDYPVRFGIAQSEPKDSRFELLYMQTKALFEMLEVIIENMEVKEESLLFRLGFNFDHYKPLWDNDENK